MLMDESKSEAGQVKLPAIQNKLTVIEHAQESAGQNRGIVTIAKKKSGETTKKISGKINQIAMKNL